MKKIGKILFVLLISLSLLTACGDKKQEVSDNKGDDEAVYSLKYNGMTMTPGELFSTDIFGDYLDYTELTTCAFEDMDRVYTYEHYEISTYTLNKEERILSVLFIDQEIATPEGVRQGDSIDSMLNAYGNDYQQFDNLYEYSRGKTLLDFIVENDVIVSIEYVYNTEN